MSVEKREGVLDRVNEKGIVLSGARLSYSKWFEGERPSEAILGSKITVLVDAGEKCSFLKRVLAIGEKVPGWTAPPSSPPSGSWAGGGGRRLSPEELDLKKAEGVRIARCCAIERAVDMAGRGVTVEKIASDARALEEYFLTGQLPTQAIVAEVGVSPKGSAPAKLAPVPTPIEALKSPTPSPQAKPKRLESRAVNALFNEAKRGGLVADWKDYESLIRKVLGMDPKSAYHLSSEDFAKVESFVRSRQKSAKVA